MEAKKPKTLTAEELGELRAFDTPTISNAIERFELRERTEGALKPEIRCILSNGKTMIGYASTARISASSPATNDQPRILMEYYEKLQSTPRPSVAVIEDIDPTPLGAFWGEVNATIHKSLGCVGTITNGGVRDLYEVEVLDFGYWAQCVLVSHGYVHLEDFGVPVKIGGILINPGDLLAADRHGAVLIPNEIAGELAAACRKTVAAESPVLEGCRRAIAAGEELDLRELREWRAEMARLRAAE